VIGLVRAVYRYADVGGLLVCQLRQLHAERVQMQRATFSSRCLGSTVDLLLVLLVLREQLDLGDRLVL